VNFLAGIFAVLFEKLFLRLIGWGKEFLAKKAAEKKEKAREAIYDKQVQDATNKYKEAKTAKEQEDAFQNLINSARRH